MDRKGVSNRGIVKTLTTNDGSSTKRKSENRSGFHFLLFCFQPLDLTYWLVSFSNI